MAGVSNSNTRWTTSLAAALIALFLLSPVNAQAQDGRPIADAGPSRYAGPDPVVLDGTGSYDPDDSGPLSYSWRQISGPSVVIVDENSATPTIAGSIQPGTGRNPEPKLGGFPQTSEIQECEFELVVSDGDMTSLPDTMKVIIVPDFGENLLELKNDFFDVHKPTIIYFGGGDCTNGQAQYGTCPLTDSGWSDKVNIISFPKGYGPDSDNSRTYYRCGDMILVYLSAVAPFYSQPIQTSGWSTGGQPAIDIGKYLNLTYQDRRYAINRVTFFDATPYCQDYSERISEFLVSSVDGEQCWIDNYVSSSAWSGYTEYPYFYNNVLNIWFEKGAGSSVYGSTEWLKKHRHAQEWYNNSLTKANMTDFNSGVVAGAYWSVVGPGKNLQLGSIPDTQTYKFTWYGWNPAGYMDFYNKSNHPGRLPEPVTLVEPVDVGDPNGFVFTCEESENAVGYELLFGTDPDRVMDYAIISDTPAPPNDVITTPGLDGFWWTVRVRDAYGSTIYADPKYFSIDAYYPDPAESVEVDEEDDGGQVELDLGEILVVTLASNPSTGYRWEWVENNESILEQLGEAEFISSETGDPPLIGAGGWEIFRFKAVSAGQMILKLVYHRPWEDVEPLKTFFIQVIVH